MRWVLVGIALCGAAPAFAFELGPDASSFAYAATHFYPGMPFEYASAQELLPRPSEDNVFLAVEKVPQSFSRVELCQTAADAASENRIPVRFFANLIQQESGFKPHVVSSAGAQGIAQFMPEVAAEQGLRNPFDPIQALKASAKLISDLVGRFGNVGLAAAAYNAGPRRVSDWLARRGRLPAETRNYVRSITGRPAERWVRVASIEETTLPPHAECPGMPVVAARAVTKIKTIVAHPIRGRLARVATRLIPAKPRLIAAKRPAPAAHHRVRLAARWQLLWLDLWRSLPVRPNA